MTNQDGFGFITRAITRPNAKGGRSFDPWFLVGVVMFVVEENANLLIRSDRTAFHARNRCTNNTSCTSDKYIFIFHYSAEL